MLLVTGYYIYLFMRTTKPLIKNITYRASITGPDVKTKLNSIADVISKASLDCSNLAIKFFPKTSGCSRGVIVDLAGDRFLIKTYNGLNKHLSRFSGDICVLPNRELSNDEVMDIFSAGSFNAKECFDEFLAMRHLKNFYSYSNCNIHTDKDYLFMEQNFSQNARALYIKSLSPWRIDQDSTLYHTNIKAKLRKLAKKTFWIEASLGAYDFLHQIAYSAEETFHRIDTFGDKQERSLTAKMLNMYFPPEELKYFSSLEKKSTNNIPKALLSAYGLKLFEFTTAEMIDELDHFIEYVAEYEKTKEKTDQMVKLKSLTLEEKHDYVMPTLSDLKSLKQDLQHYEKEEFLGTLKTIAKIQDINYEQKLSQKKVVNPYLEEFYRNKKKITNQETSLMR